MDVAGRTQRAELARLRRACAGVALCTLPRRFVDDLGEAALRDFARRLGGTV
jgi:hypothetical protein